MHFRPTCYPIPMKKTSVYLTDEDVARLRRLAAIEGVSQALVLREAIVAYDATMNGRRLVDRSAASEDVAELFDTFDEQAREAADAIEHGERFFALDGCVSGDGSSAADIEEDDYLAGFGD